MLRAPIRLSSRTTWSLEENELERARRSLREAGTEIWDLTATNPTRIGLRELDQLRGVLDGLGRTLRPRRARRAHRP